MAKAATPVKEVTILARVEFKSDARKVVYQCLSSNGKDKYNTFLFNGKASSCECPSTKPCYHMTGCEAHEAARNEARQPADEQEDEAPGLVEAEKYLAKLQAEEDERNARRTMLHSIYNVDGLN